MRPVLQHLALVGVVAAVLAMSGPVRAQALPDLVIVNVVVPNATTAVVLVQNQGLVTCSPCLLRMDVYTHTGIFLGWRQVFVPALAPGQALWVPINAAPLILAPGRVLKLHVDVTNVVPETNELNNRFTRIT